MPADRRITVNVEAEGTRNEYNEYVPGDVAALTVWASKYDLRLIDIEEAGGVRSEVTRRWRLRYDSRIYDTPVDRLEVVDGTQTFDITQVREVTAQRDAPDLRRKYIELTGIFTT